MIDDDADPRFALTLDDWGVPHIRRHAHRGEGFEKAGLARPLELQTGTDFTLAWQARETHVTESTFVTIRMKSSGQYHRYGTGNDADVALVYSVDPP